MRADYVEYDRLVVGAGLFGLYAALLSARAGLRVAVVDLDQGQVMRASLVNQARVHNGYHYPRSAYTALRSASYYDRFGTDFPGAVNRRFTKIYAISATRSLTDAEHFERFCRNVGIRVRRADPLDHFQPRVVEASYETDEYSFDAPALRREMLDRLCRAPGSCTWQLGDTIAEARANGDTWELALRSGIRVRTPSVVNAAYAGINGILRTFGFPPMPLKYELCEVALVEAPRHVDVGITVMDGPFFSLMPFGLSGTHSLTAVDYTPRVASASELPGFPCQSLNPACSPAALDNCSLCQARPASAYPRMLALARRYLAHVDDIALRDTINSVKAILRTSEVDDARPTLVRVDSTAPHFVSLFSGKINTIYDLEDVL